jgi:hypothetical protein
MATLDRDTAVGVFTDVTHAEQAIEELRTKGFASERIEFIADDPPNMEAPLVESGTQARKGALVGATVGGLFGAALGLAAAVFIFPEAGPLLVGALLAWALGGAVAVGVSGGIIGTVIGLNVPEDEARHCEQQFHSGRSQVTVHAGDRYEEALDIMRCVAERPEHHHTRHRTTELSSDTAPRDGAGSVFVPRP